MKRISQRIGDDPSSQTIHLRGCIYGWIKEIKAYFLLDCLIIMTIIPFFIWNNYLASVLLFVQLMFGENNSFLLFTSHSERNQTRGIVLRESHQHNQHISFFFFFGRNLGIESEIQKGVRLWGRVGSCYLQCRSVLNCGQRADKTIWSIFLSCVLLLSYQEQ